MKKLLILICILITSTLDIAAQQFNIQHYTVKEGLSDNFVNNIFQDSFGYLWISTSYGLDRYDGYSFKHYFYNSSRTQSLCSNFINHVQEDKEHNMWISTDAGVSCFNYSKQTIETIKFTEKKYYFVSKTLIHNNLLYAATDNGIVIYNNKTKKSFLLDMGNLTHESFHDIAIDKHGRLWFTRREYAYCYNLKNKKIKSYKTEKSLHYLNDELWLKISVGEDGTLWLATANGLLEYNEARDHFNKIVDTEGNISIATKGTVIWIANWESGLIRYDRKTKVKEYISQSTAAKDNSGFSPLVCVYIDKDNILWAGGGRGIMKFTSKSESIKYYDIGDKSVNAPLLPAFQVRAVLVDSHNDLWVGAEDGIRKIDQKTKSIEIYKSVSGIPQEKLNNQVLSLCEDNKGTMWVGTISGLNILNRKEKTFNYFSKAPKDIFLISNQIWNIQKDKSGLFWIGTRLGLFHFNPETRLFSSFFSSANNPNTINDSRVMSVLPTKNAVYVGTKNGFCSITGQNLIKRYTYQSDNKFSIASNSVNYLFQDKKNRIWVLSDQGLQRFLPDEEKFVTVNALEGNRLLTGTEDNKGRLWILSNNNIFIFDPVKNDLKLLTDVTEAENSYTYAAPFKTKDGKLFFGKTDGVCFINPDKMFFNNKIPDVNLCSFNLFAKELIPGEKNSPLKSGINQIKELRLSYKQNFFSIDYVAVSFNTSLRLHYAYILEGFDNKWINAGERRTAYYTKMPPGKYIFRVKALDSMGQPEGSEKSFRIIITPPFYNTIYAYFVYAILVVLMLYFFRRYTIIQVIEKSKLERSLMEQKKEHELYNSKVQFFMNISHEFRTPLTLILDPVQHLLDIEGSQQKSKYLLSISKNTKRLLLLVNQLLEFRKVETGTLQLRVSENNIIACISEIIHTFDDLALHKQITIKLKTELESCNVWFDLDMFERIMFNLLSNAFKYTPPEGNITISVAIGTENITEIKREWWLLKKKEINKRKIVRVSIEDTGIGIPQDKLEMVFERYYQVPSTVKTEGTGIGLSLVKNLVLLHQGTIAATSEEGKGTCFTFTLPLGRAHISDAQIVDYPMNEYVVQMNPDDMFFSDPDRTFIESDFIDLPSMSNKPVVLVVEDNKEIIMYIKNCLQLTYEVIMANNGQNGLEKAIKTMPNIIFCDINMPVMNGIELTKRLKKNELTNHIPVILLTANTSEESQLEAFSCGADDYITKPFNIKLLEAKMFNILNHEKEIRKKFRQQAIYEKVVGDNSIHSDDAFLTALNKFLGDNITNPELDVDLIARGLFISRSQLYRKVTALSDFSVKEYVKLYRLKMAESLLSQKDMRISEVMDNVGFNNRSYFIASFKKVYIMTPSEYKNSKTRNQE